MRTSTRSVQVVEVEASTKPAWVSAFLGDGALPTETAAHDDLQVEVVVGEGRRFVEVTRPNAVDLGTADFQRLVRRVYRVVYERLDDLEELHPLRFWNFIPDIHHVEPDGRERYEVFNAGRFEAFTDWYRTPRFGPRMIAASGVDPRGPDLVVQALAAAWPGRGLENPRQRPAYRYSKKYGPLPPCFARATLVEDGPEERRMMIVAGTSSVVGESSCHPGDVEKQLEETCTNLEHLVALADRRTSSPLSRFEELRVYVMDSESQDRLVERMVECFPGLDRIELMPADLCRADLLVEIEGVLRLGKGS
jgi:chorismate lyase/3-hydroxybenzoate synthase